VVSATTATAAVSAASVGPLAHGDAASFAALSAALALVTAVVLVAGGALRLGAVADLVSKPVMTGFLFGLGMVIMLAQVPSILGVKPGDGNFFPALVDVLGELGDVHAATLAVGLGSIAVLLLGRRLLPAFASTLLVLIVAIAVSALLDLSSHGVDVVGDIPNALPDPAIPHVSADDLVALITPAVGILIMSAEAVGVARALAVKHGYQVDPNRDLRALGVSNLLAGLSSGFVQSGGASQTAAADGAGGRTQLASIISAGLILLTGAFLAPLFKDLPQATLGAIVIVAVSGSSTWPRCGASPTCGAARSCPPSSRWAGVLALGVLQGLVVTAGLALVYVVQRLSRPPVGTLARDPVSGAWGRGDRHEGWRAPDGALVARSDGPLLYPNVNLVKDRVLALVAAADPRPRTVVLDLSSTTDLDVQTADTIDELHQQLARDGIELHLAAVRAPAREVLDRAGVSERVPIAATIDEALADSAEH
jgi:SulP family sulfate permease